VGENEIQRKIDEVQNELHAENQRGALRDSAKVERLQEQLNGLLVQLEETQYKANVVESQSEIAYILDNLQVEGISMRELFRNETLEGAESAYNLLRTVIQSAWMEREEKLLSDAKDAREQLALIKTDRDQLQTRYDELYETSASQRNEIHALRAEVEDLQHKRDSAARELMESEERVRQLESQVDDLRKEIAVGAVNAVKVIDVGDAYDNYIKQKKKEEESKPAIYDVTPTDNKRSRYTAKLAETDELINFSYLEKGRYREVTAQEAETFRRAYQEKCNHEDIPQPGIVEEVVVTPQFQEEPGLDEGNLHGEVATKTVEERLQALEIAVFGKAEVAA